MVKEEQINAFLVSTELKDNLKCVGTMKVHEEPHPFCVTSKHIKRYAIDTSAGPCGMRVNEETGEWAGKRDTKKGIIGTCGLSYEEHTYEVIILFEVLREEIETMTLLEKSLGEEAYLSKFFKENKIVGFGFAKMEEQLDEQ